MLRADDIQSPLNNKYISRKLIHVKNFDKELSAPGNLK